MTVSVTNCILRSKRNAITRSEIFTENALKTLGGRAPPGPAGGAYSAPPDPLAGFLLKPGKLPSSVRSVPSQFFKPSAATGTFPPQSQVPSAAYGNNPLQMLSIPVNTAAVCAPLEFASSLIGYLTTDDISLSKRQLDDHKCIFRLYILDEKFPALL